MEQIKMKKNGYSKEFRSMFREYDIRGLVNSEQLNEKSVYRIVKAYGALIKSRGISKAVVGYDNRDCSPAFAKSAIDALTEMGINVYYIGLSLSPVAYYAQYVYKCEGLVMITASHNPNGWSGFKLGLGYSTTLGKAEIIEVFNNVDRKFPKARKKGKVVECDVRDQYIDEVVQRIDMGEYKPRVLIETANGGAGLFAYEIFQRLGCITFLLNADPDTTYPKYFPNPSDLTARKKMEELVTHKYIHADLGMFFDGDGDRVGVVDENGNNVWSDTVLALLAEPMTKKNKDAKIVYDVKCSRALTETIKKAGGTPIMWSTGHSFIKSKMKEVGAVLAGERSGHIFIGGDEYLGYDDGIFAGAKIAERLSKAQKPLSKLVDKLPKYFTSPEIYVDCDDCIKYDIVNKLVERFKEMYPGKVCDINGARVEFENGWGLVRASSNMPLLGLLFEGKTKQDVHEIKKIFKSVMGSFKELHKPWINDDEE